MHPLLGKIKSDINKLDVWWTMLPSARVAEVRGPLTSEGRGALLPLPPRAARFGPARLDAFLLGRTAARLALAELGHGVGCLDIGERGAPVWPAGVVGSITHDGSFAAAAVATGLRGIGIDLQRRSVENAETVAYVATRQEMDAVWACPPEARFTVVFSGKETLYKCLAPTVGAVFGFDEAHVVGMTATTLRLRLTRPLYPGLGAGTVFDVRWSLQGDVVRTALEWA